LPWIQFPDGKWTIEEERMNHHLALVNDPRQGLQHRYFINGDGWISNKSLSTYKKWSRQNTAKAR